MHLNLLVLKTHDVPQLRKFYEVLGLAFQQEQHGTGPIHYSAQLGDGVLELYPLPEDQTVDTSTRLGIAVDDIHVVIPRLYYSQFKVVKDPIPTETGWRAVARDPDGRAVEVFQPTTWTPPESREQNERLRPALTITNGSGDGFFRIRVLSIDVAASRKDKGVIYIRTEFQTRLLYGTTFDVVIPEDFERLLEGLQAMKERRSSPASMSGMEGALNLECDWSPAEDAIGFDIRVPDFENWWYCWDDPEYRRQNVREGLSLEFWVEISRLHPLIAEIEAILAEIERQRVLQSGDTENAE